MKRFDWRGLSRWGQPGRGGVGVLIKDDWTVADEVSLSSKGIESIWVSVGNKGVADTLLGVVYFTPHCGREVFDKGAKIIDFVLEKQWEGLKVVITGDFNAHFDENGVAQDNKASFLSDLSQMAGLSIMNWQPGVAGKWTWASGGQHSVLDYVLLSGGLVERIDRFVVDDEGFFDIGSDHNLMFWYIGTGKEETVSPKVKRKVRKEWRWRVGGNVNWEAYHVSIEDRMDRVTADMM